MESKQKFKMSQKEYDATKMILDYFDIECESDYSVTCEYKPLYCGDKELAFTERYLSLCNIPMNMSIFRPLKYEKHANIIIEMFEQSFDLPRNSYLNITEQPLPYQLVGRGRKLYSGGYMVGDATYGTQIANACSVAMVKILLVASFIFSDYEYELFVDLAQSHSR